MNRERWFLVAGAVVSVLGDFILKLLETDLSSLYFLPWIITGSILVAIKVGLAIFDQWLDEKSRHRAKHVHSSQDGEIILRGMRQGADFESGDFALDFLMYGFVFSIALALGGTGLLLGGFFRHEYKAVWIALVLVVASWTSLTYIQRITFGQRASLVVSSDGVTFKGRRGQNAPRERVSIQWNDVVDFAVVESEETHGPWLVAIPPPRSPLIFRGASSKLYDRENNRILICSLDDVDIQKHLVLGALDEKRPTSRGH